MHYESLYEMANFVKKYLDPNKKLKILEVGSKDDANPRKSLRYRRYFENKINWEFIGLDIEMGRNVDVVATDLYHYPFDTNSFDVVISGNTIEHVKDIYAFVRELARLTRDLLWISAPNYRPLHEYPIDCWRIYPDGMTFLLEEVAGLKILECKRCGNKELSDTVGITKKI